MLMVIDDVAEATEDQMSVALTRARLSENVAVAVGAPADAAFMAGLITGVADLLGLPHTAMAEQLPLSADIADALADGSGPLGEVLRVVNAYENGEPTGIAGGTMAGQYMDAIRWSARALQATSRLASV
jgi:EAL and modified HD-GYP domain-containing signal transduction protein